MHPEAMIATFKSLKLFGMTQAIDDLAEQGSPAWHSAESVLDALLKAEVAEREVRSINYQMKAARFLIQRNLNGFDFADSAVNEALVRSLHRGEFIDDTHNVVLIDGPGTGKTHLATAIGLQTIVHQHRRVRCFSTIELVNVVEQKKAAGKPGRWPFASHMSTWLYSMNWAICRSARPAVRCCPTC
jgi:DNA replication protein DnaC